MGHKPPKTTEHPVDVHLGQRIRALRLSRNMSTRDLGQALGVSYQQIQKYETGTNRISASTLFELTNVLWAPVSFPFEGLAHSAQTSPMPPPSAVANLADLPDGEALAQAICAMPPAARGRLLAFLRTLGSRPVEE